MRGAIRFRSLLALTGITACTSGSITGGNEGDEGPDAAAPDGGSEAAATDGSAKPCTDCEYFPEVCSADVLCPNGPFDPATAGGALDGRTSINVIRGRSASDVWAAGAVGAMAHFDGSSWTRSELGAPESMRTLWLRDGVEVSIGGFLDRVYARGVGLEDGGAPSSGGWALHTPSFAPGQEPARALLTSTWSASGSEWLWCGTKGAYNGAQGGIWRLRRSPSSGFEGGIGIAAASCRSVGCNQVASVHGATADALWAVGPAGATIRITGADGDAPVARAFDSRTLDALNGVWEASASEAWSVGAVGTIRHYAGDPKRWEIVSDVPTGVDLNAVWGSSPIDVWAVGDAGVVLHYDGKAWSRMKIAGLGEDRPNLHTVWVAGPGHVWIGGQGVILSLGGKP